MRILIFPRHDEKSNYSQHISLSLFVSFRSFFVNRDITLPFHPRRSLIKRADIAEINVGMSVHPEITEGRAGRMVISQG